MLDLVLRTKLRRLGQTQISQPINVNIKQVTHPWLCNRLTKWFLRHQLCGLAYMEDKLLVRIWAGNGSLHMVYIDWIQIWSPGNIDLKKKIDYIN